MTQANNLQLFTVRDAAKLLTMSEHSIRRLIKQRKLPVVRIEQRVMLTKSGIAVRIPPESLFALDRRRYSICSGKRTKV
jgi:excisionase family DNA binding protein